MHGQSSDVDATELDRTGIGADQPHGHVEGGGLAGAVGSEKAHDLTRTHMDRHPIDHAPARIGLGQSLTDSRGVVSWEPTGVAVLAVVLAAEAMVSGIWASWCPG